MPRYCTIGAIPETLRQSRAGPSHAIPQAMSAEPDLALDVRAFEVGPDRPLCIIAGPCLLESFEMARTIAQAVVTAASDAGVSIVFKGSFDKANRSSIKSSRGPGLERGVEWLAKIREEFRVPVTTDVHESSQALAVAEQVDVLQVPAFLCRQTDLLCAIGEAAVKFGRAVNVKKGQFLSPGEMGGAVRKLGEVGCGNIMLTERGTTFGYHRLVNDFIGIKDLMQLAVAGGPPPVCFDCTHSTQTPGTGDTTGGRPDAAPMLARAAVAAGVHAVFMECHPEPASAQSDASTMLALRNVPAIMRQIAAIHLVLTKA